MKFLTFPLKKKNLVIQNVSIKKKKDKKKRVQVPIPFIIFFFNEKRGH